MKVPNIKRNVFDMSHERKLSCDMGVLVPVFCEEVVPGDYFKVNSSMIVRITPLVAPMMHRVDVFTHFFFVPNRLLWTDWEKFITGGTDGLDATEWPHFELGNAAAGSLTDYLGLPVPGYASTDLISALPFRAYNKIYNEWYRDQNFQTEIVVNMGNGADATTPRNLLSRNWEKDYFTSALPWAQRGNPVSLPLGTVAPVVGVSGGTITLGRDGSSDTYTLKLGDAPGGFGERLGVDPNPGTSTEARWKATSLQADLSTATAATINQIRQAFQIQKWMERNARGGVRYVESILAHFGVRSSDARLQRPEFLGGGRSPIVVSEVLQTSKTDVSPQGNMAGHGFSAQSAHAFAKGFEEHGFIIGIMSIMPRTAYQQGINRMWNRSTKYHYFWPEFANLGEQEVLNRELYVANDGLNDTLFGYQGRYDEYRRRESVVCGNFRSSLNFWHMGRIFAARPTLGSTFITADPTKRVNAITTEHTCLVQMMHNVKAVRPIPLEGEPGFVDH